MIEEITIFFLQSKITQAKMSGVNTCKIYLYFGTSFIINDQEDLLCELSTEGLDYFKSNGYELHIEDTEEGKGKFLIIKW